MSADVNLQLKERREEVNKAFASDHNIVGVSLTRSRNGRNVRTDLDRVRVNDGLELRVPVVDEEPAWFADADDGGRDAPARTRKKYMEELVWLQNTLC